MPRDSQIGYSQSNVEECEREKSPLPTSISNRCQQKICGAKIPNNLRVKPSLPRPCQKLELNALTTIENARHEYCCEEKLWEGQGGLNPDFLADLGRGLWAGAMADTLQRMQ
jgi:hypothetical protein